MIDTGDFMPVNPPRTRVFTASSCSVPLFSRDDPYVRFLLENRNRVFYMKPWDGNSGDDLIWLGTEYLLDSLHLSRTLDPRAADVILIPGGNQTMWWPNIDVWKEVWSRWPDKDFVVGPTTIYLGITNWDQDVRQSHARVRAIFARDPESYAILQTCGFDGDITTGLSHDPAVFLRDSELIRAHKEAATNDFVLATFRDDWEGTRPLRERLGRWADLVPSCVQRRMDRHRRKKSRESKIAHVARRTRCTRPLRTCDVSNYPFPYFLEMVRSAAEVHTDRLHCMLLAVMLGKPTFAYPTTYRKLEAVYEHSVKDWAHVEFVRDTLNLPAFVSTAHRVVRIV